VGPAGVELHERCGGWLALTTQIDVIDHATGRPASPCTPPPVTHHRDRSTH
jgi:hypothetical protein